LKKKYLILFYLFLLTFDLNSVGFIDHVEIKSDKVEFSNNSKNVSFLSNVNINSNYVVISASSAIYDNKKELISISGDPSSIRSNKNDNNFNGEAEKIIFFSDEKVHLIGNASIKFDNLSIRSNLIIFNPMSGKIMSSE
tara:strand:+ start:697 stop:1113 length:417 start_codon:yes stop_codon:yes gene_type:complete